MRRVIGYCRVSTESQADSGLSLEAQERKIRQFAELHDFEIVDVLVDAGYSGKDLSRPAVQQCFDLLAEGYAEGLVIAKMDRLSRHLQDWIWIVNEFFGEGLGRSLYSIGDSIDTSSPSGMLVLHVLAAVAEWERAEISRRITVALQEKIAKNEHIGVAPYGMRYAPDGTLEPDTYSPGLIVAYRANELRSEGLSYQKIADRLLAEGFRPQRAKRFSTSAVRNLCTNLRILSVIHDETNADLLREMAEAVRRDGKAVEVVLEEWAHREAIAS